MKISAIFFFLLSFYNLIQLFLGNSFNGAKVIIEPSNKAIIMQIILLLILGYLSIKLKYEEH